MRTNAVARLVEMLGRIDRSVEGTAMCEIGSGWQPVVPAVFYGMGAESIVMTDIAAHMETDLVARTMKHLDEHADEMAQITGVPAKQLQLRWRDLMPVDGAWQQRWAERGLVYLAPHHFDRPTFPSGAFDVVYSNSVLGYVPSPTVEAIFRETHRLLRPGGWLMHRISTYDDFANSDPTITPLNFLTFDREDWERIGNSAMHHQNRLRPAEYVALAERHGLEVLLQDREPEHLLPEMLDDVVLDAEFADLPVDEVLCAHLILAAERPR
ncbi:MAG: methyltransferase domain-containing protein [Ilumatobacter sp.]|nr:methyltransferase domain-containing protein [Ilumatobacter sp.]